MKEQWKKGDILVSKHNDIKVLFEKITSSDRFSGTITETNNTRYYTGQYVTTWTINSWKLHKKGNISMKEQWEKGDILVSKHHNLKLLFETITNSFQFSGTITEGNSVYNTGVYSDTWTINNWKLYKKGNTNMKEQWKKGNTNMKELYKKGDTNMKNLIKEKATKVYSVIKPYEKYLILAAFLVAIDYFIFKGKYTDKLKDMSKKIFDKCSDKVNNFIDKI